MSQVLYRKWRPQSWETVIGQDHIVSTLRNALLADRISHAYLFAGPRGTGKTTTARLLAKSVNCLEPDLELRPCGECDHCKALHQGRFLDLIEIDGASTNSVEDVRDLRDKINFSPNQGRYKVYIIDEVHMLSTQAFNALLKTLEEPPGHAIFILATTEEHKIPATVTSRCQRHEFRRISLNDIVSNLETIVQGEDIQIETETMTLIARQATGSMRDAISLLDQLASSGESITLEFAHTVLGTAASQAVLVVIDALIDAQPAVGLDQIHSTLDGGSDPRYFARQIVDYLRGLLLVRMGNADQIEATSDMRSEMARHAQALKTQDLLDLIQAFNHAATRARGVWQPSLPLEMAFVQSLEFLSGSATEKKKAEPLTGEKSNSEESRRDTTREKVSVEGGGKKETAAIKENPVDYTPEDRKATRSLSQVWSQILHLVRQRDPKAYGLLNSARSPHIQGNDLVLNFASELLKGQMEKEENQKYVCQALSEVLSRDVNIHCRVDASQLEAIPSEVEDDGMVAAALRDLGGEIVDVQ